MISHLSRAIAITCWILLSVALGAEPILARESLLDCSLTHPVQRQLANSGLEANRPVCNYGATFSFENNQNTEYLRPGVAVSFTTPQLIENIEFISTTINGRQSELTLQLQYLEETVRLPLRDSVIVEVEPETEYKIEIVGNQSFEVGLAVRPVYQVWYGEYRLILSEDNLEDMAVLPDPADNFFIVDNAEFAAWLGIEYQLRALAPAEESLPSESVPVTWIEGDYQRVLYAVNGYPSAVLFVRDNGAGGRQNIVVVTEDLLRLDNRTLPGVLSRIVQNLTVDPWQEIAGPALNPALASWGLALSALVQSALPYLLLLLTIIALLISAVVSRLRQAGSWRSLFHPAVRWYWRLGQMVILALIAKAGVVLLLVWGMMSHPSPGVVWRTFLSRLRGFELSGEEYCRKCFLIGEGSWLLVPLLIVVIAAVVWMSWYELQVLRQRLIKSYMNYLKSSGELIRWHYYGLVAVIVGIVLGGAGLIAASLMPMLGAVLIFLIWVAPPAVLNYRPAAVFRTLGVVLLLTVAAYALYGGVMSRYRLFDDRVETQTRLLSRTGWVNYPDGRVVTPDSTRPLVFGFESLYAGSVRGYALELGMDRAASLMLASELSQSRVPLVVDAKLADFSEKTSWERRALWSRTPLADEASLAEQLSTLPAGQRVAILLPEDDPWQRATDDYFNRTAYWTTQTPPRYPSGEFRHELNLIARPYTMYLYAHHVLALTLTKQDLNLTGASAAMSATLMGPDGDIIAFGQLEDGGGALGETSMPQTVALEMSEEGFSPGVYRLVISPGETNPDFLITDIVVNTPYLMVEGPLSVASGQTFYPLGGESLRVERLNAIDFSLPQMVCLYRREEQRRCLHPHQSSMVFERSGEQPREFSISGRDVSVGQPYQLFALSQEALFDPFRLQFGRAIHSDTQAVIADRRIEWVGAIDPTPTAGVRVRISEQFERSRTNQPLWQTRISTEPQQHQLPSLWDVQLTLEK